MLGQRQVVGVVGRRQAEGIGEDKRLMVQPCGVVKFDGKGEECGEMFRRPNEGDSVLASHALPQNVCDLEWQQRRRNDRLVRGRGRVVESDCPIASLLLQKPFDRNRRVHADHDN